MKVMIYKSVIFFGKKKKKIQSAPLNPSLIFNLFWNVIVPVYSSFFFTFPHGFFKKKSDKILWLDLVSGKVKVKI